MYHGLFLFYVPLPHQYKIKGQIDTLELIGTEFVLDLVNRY